MKKIFTSLVVIALLWVASTYASDKADDSTMTPSEHPMMMSGSTDMMRDHMKMWSGSMMNGEMKAMREKDHEEMKAKREQVKEGTKANREQMKANIKEFKDAHDGGMMKAMSGSLTTEQKDSLKSLHDTHKTEMDALMTELKAAKWDETKMAAVFTKIEAARASHLDELKVIVGDNPDMAKMVDARKAVFQENKTLRDENRTNRKVLRDGIEDKVVKYKEVFVQKISKKLEKLSSDQVQKIIDKVDAQLTKVEANTKLSVENKAKVKAQLVALRETLEDRLDTSSAQNDMTEVQSMIESVAQ